MGILYIAVCDSKKEYLDPGELGLNTKHYGWSDGPAGRALLSAMRGRWYDGAVRLVGDTGDEYHDLVDGKDGYDDVTGDIWHEYHWRPEGTRDERINNDADWAWCPVCKVEGEEHKRSRMLNDFLSIARDRHALTAAKHEIRFEIGSGDKMVRDVSYEDIHQVLEAMIRGFLHQYQKVEQDLPEPVRTRSVLLKLARDVIQETEKAPPGGRLEDLRKRAQAILDEETRP